MIEMKNMEGCSVRYPEPDDTSMQMEERYLCREKEPARTLLPGEEIPCGEGRIVTLKSGIYADGAAGVGGIAANGGCTLGAWCSYCCRLAVPRRFAAQKGRQMAQGVQSEAILQETWREMLQMLLKDMACPTPANPVQLKKQMNRRLRDTAERELMDLGWQLVHCRLEKILITRGETDE